MKDAGMTGKAIFYALGWLDSVTMTSSRNGATAEPRNDPGARFSI
jgi:hypothetical protein